MGVTVHRSGPSLKGAIARVLEVRRSSVTIGVHGEQGKARDAGGGDVTVLDKAVWNEFGVTWGEAGLSPSEEAIRVREEAGYPAPSTWFIAPRSFLRATFAEQRAAWADQSKRVMRAVVVGTIRIDAGLARLGSVARADVLRHIDAMETPAKLPGAPPDKLRLLRRTGQLWQSIRWEASVAGRKTGIG